MWASAERLRDPGRGTLPPTSHGALEPPRGTAGVLHADAVSEPVTLVIAEVHVFPPSRSTVAAIVMEDTRTVTPMVSVDVQPSSRNCAACIDVLPHKKRPQVLGSRAVVDEMKRISYHCCHGVQRDPRRAVAPRGGTT